MKAGRGPVWAIVSLRPRVECYEISPHHKIADMLKDAVHQGIDAFVSPVAGQRSRHPLLFPDTLQHLARDKGNRRIN
jgi:hypothetical protein